ncbi:hypothetical protein SAMN05660297_00265 [Natronincola peptidivorans]|uniref:Uncharacterized protein n=1 Tax=Natronincola peptidivorans TaxID=426128 RepID=A0A1H9YJI0_9FIRM|nr:hypothetical protein [Natronincola peptidivorans]SES69199.1 hypothetical protein SAMN05660297_00265 [Natronincola peptidivorans]
MIQIDDAGSGSLLGGTIIGALRVETNEYYHSVIPLDYYKGENFQKKAYIHYVISIVEDLLNKLKVDKNEPIEVCRGYMFDASTIWLRENNYNYVKTVIKDPLQTKIEQSFEEYAIGLGLPKMFISYTKYPFHFHRILKWVYADYPNRSILCKTGWKSWKKHGNLKLQYSSEVIKTKNLICLKCYNIIPHKSIGKVITFYSNRKTKVFIHPTCI